MANIQPAQDITDPSDQPSVTMNLPLNSYTVAAMTHPKTPRSMIRPSTYTPVPAMTNVTSTPTV